MLTNDADERFFQMMTIYSSECRDSSFEILTSIYDVYLQSEKFKDSLERNLNLMTQSYYLQIAWLTNIVIDHYPSKYDIIKSIAGREASTPFGAHILHEAREQIHTREGQDKPWITMEQLDEIDVIFQATAINTLSNKQFYNHHLETRIFVELMASSKDKTAKFISEILNGANGAIRVAEIIGRTGSDSDNGPFVQIDEIFFSDVIDMVLLKEKVNKVQFEEQPLQTLAALNSILDGETYYLRDGRKKKHR